MKNFRQSVLREFIGPLRGIYENIADGYDDDMRHEAFRLAHSVKGCSRTFGLRKCADHAAQLEAVLVEGRFDENAQAEVLERLALLIEALSRPDTVPAVASRPFGFEFISKTNIFRNRITFAVFAQLTAGEKAAFFEALEKGRRTYVFRASVRNSDLVADFSAVRQMLSETGQIVAFLPGQDSDPERTTLLAICAARPDETVPDGAEALDFRAEDDDPATQVVAGVTDHIARLTHESSKIVELTVLVNDLRLSDGLSRTLFEILIHLTANSVDHGILKSGRLEVLVFDAGESLTLIVEDNGKGIDPKFYTSAAVDGAGLGRIFDPGVSAAEPGLPNSGLGFGLNVVRERIAQMNGKISVASRKDCGTRFEISLPL